MLRLVPLLLLTLLRPSFSMSFVSPVAYRAKIVARRSGQCWSFPRGRKRYLSRPTSVVMMPEGPEVKTLVNQLQKGVGLRLVDLRFISGRYATTKPRGFESFAPTMTKFVKDETPEQTDIIQGIHCKGKFIYILLDRGSRITTDDSDYERSIWITLGMTGKFLTEKESQESGNIPRWHLDLLDIQSGRRTKIMYHDTRNFGTLRFSLSRQELIEKLESLGPDIFALTESEFESILATTKQDTNICKFLMNQAKISGIGNYLLAEGLYRAGVDPYASIAEIQDGQRRVLFHELRAATEESYASLNNEGDFEMYCYGRDVCAKGKPVRRDTNGPHGRTIHYIDDQLFKPRTERGASPLQQTNVQKRQFSKDHAVSLEDALSEKSWKDLLNPFFESSTCVGLKEFLYSEYESGATVYPPQREIFASLNACPFEGVKVVIVGQDPYHGPGQAHGFAFSVRDNIIPPPSLKNIFKEAMKDVGIKQPTSGNLECWAKQGVLLLNTVLTVRKGEANSHANKGWESLTDMVIEQLNVKREGLVFLLWGRPAQAKAKNVDETRHTVIRTSHPSPLGATKTDSPFIGSRCFSRANEALKEPINWNVTAD